MKPPCEGNFPFFWVKQGKEDDLCKCLVIFSMEKELNQDRDNC